MPTNRYRKRTRSSLRNVNALNIAEKLWLLDGNTPNVPGDKATSPNRTDRSTTVGGTFSPDVLRSRKRERPLVVPIQTEPSAAEKNAWLLQYSQTRPSDRPY